MAQIVVALMFMVSVVVGGTAYAADAAEPGDLLYGLDLALEQVQLDLAPNAEAAAMDHLEHAAERLVEAQNRLVDGEVDEAIIALNLYGETIASLGQLIASAEGVDQDALTEMLNAALEIHQDILAIVLEIVPEEAKEAIEKAIEVSTPPVIIPGGPPEELPVGPPEDVEPPADIPDAPPVDVPPVDIPDDPPVDIPPVDILDVPPVDIPPVDILDDPPVDVEPPADIPDDPPEDVEPPEDIPAPPPVPTEEPEIPEIPAPEPPAEAIIQLDCLKDRIRYTEGNFPSQIVILCK